MHSESSKLTCPAGLEHAVQVNVWRRWAYSMGVVSIVLLMATITGCSRPSGPASTDTISDSLPSLQRRVEFLQRYVTFRRGYDELGFHIVYRSNGGGLVPASSEWDIRLVAVVPSAEISAWVPSGAVAIPSGDKQWLTGVPGAERTGGIGEWYAGPGWVIGLDRKHSVVAYRRWTH